MPFKKAKRLVKKARKTVKKLIPKEIRPFVPYIAAAMGPAGFATQGIFANPAVTKALIAGGTRFATDDEADLKDVGITAALAATPDLISQGTGKFIDTPERLAAIKSGNAAPAMTKTQQGLQAIRGAVEGAGPVKTIATQAGIDAASQLAEINQDALDEYNRKLAEQGITDAKERRSRIRDIYLGVGYDEDYVDGLLDRYGYKSGGSTYTIEDILDMAGDLTKKKRKDKEEEDEDDLSYFLEEGQKGLMSLMPKQKPVPIRPLQLAGGGDVDVGEQFEEFLMERQRRMQDSEKRRLMDEFEQYMRRQDPTVEVAEGGMINLGGNEMDLRGGGFVPIGKKEKADDVPARLYKNEFVMTADAVRGAGGGDVNEGARRMYQTMDKLEAMA